VLDAIRLGPDDDEAEVTAAQVRDVVARLVTAGHWREGDPPILVIFDAGYDVTRLAYQLADLPVELLGRLRSDRVMLLPAPPRPPGPGTSSPSHGPPGRRTSAVTRSSTTPIRPTGHGGRCAASTSRSPRPRRPSPGWPR
jgi:hypothetical protein